jgi:hypothetical protein
VTAAELEERLAALEEALQRADQAADELRAAVADAQAAWDRSTDGS